MVRVQRVLRSWRAAKAAPVQAELWKPLHHGPPTALRYPHPARVHTEVSAPALLPLGSQLGLEQGRPAAPAHEKQADVEANIAQVLFEMIRIMLYVIPSKHVVYSSFHLVVRVAKLKIYNGH